MDTSKEHGSNGSAGTSTVLLHMISDTGLWRCCLEKTTLGAIPVTMSGKSQGFSEETVLVTPRLSCLAAGLALPQ